MKEKEQEREREMRREEEERRGMVSLILILQAHNEDFITNGLLSSVISSFEGLNPLIVGTVTTEEAKKSFLQLAPGAHVFVWAKNMGMDVAAFMWCVDYVISYHRVATDAVVLKWHSKSLQTWRESLSEGFSSKFEARKSLNAFRYNPNLGMLGSGSMCIKPNQLLRTSRLLAGPQGREQAFFVRNFVMLTNLTEYDLGPMIRELEIDTFGRTSYYSERHYVAGTIFFVKFEILKKMRDGLGSKWDYLIQTSPKGHVVRSYMHAMERFFGYSVGMSGYDLHCSRDRFELHWGVFNDRKRIARGALRTMSSRNKDKTGAIFDRKKLANQHVF